jgi:hypothetical protein
MDIIIFDAAKLIQLNNCRYIFQRAIPRASIEGGKVHAEKAARLFLLRSIILVQHISRVRFLFQTLLRGEEGSHFFRPLRW